MKYGSTIDSPINSKHYNLNWDMIGNQDLEISLFVLTININYLDLPNSMQRKSKSDIKNQALHRSIKHGHTASVKSFLQAGIKCTDPDLFGKSCANGYFEIVKLLIDTGADPINPAALKQAHQNGHTDIVNLLVELGNEALAPIPKPIILDIPTPKSVSKPTDEIDDLIRDFRRNYELGNSLIYMQVLKTGGTDVNIFADKIKSITFDIDDFIGIFNESNVYQANNDPTGSIGYHLYIFRTLLREYLKYPYDHTPEELISIFMRRDIRRKILDKAVEKDHWYVAKYLLKFGANFITNSPAIANFLRINRNKFLLTYILDNSCFRIGDFCANIGRYYHYSGCAYLTSGSEAKMNYKSQLQKYLVYLRYKMIFIYKLSYPVDLIIDEHANAINDILSYVRKLYIQLHQTEYITQI